MSWLGRRWRLESGVHDRLALTIENTRILTRECWEEMAREAGGTVFKDEGECPGRGSVGDRGRKNGGRWRPRA